MTKQVHSRPLSGAAWAVAVGAALLMTGSASAAEIIDLIRIGGSPPNNFAEDDNRTYLVNRAGGTTTLDVGDSLRALITFRQLNGTTIGDTNDNRTRDAHENPEWTAVVQVIVTEKTRNADGTYSFNFGADPTFGSFAGDSANYSSDSPGAIAVFYADSSNNLDIDAQNSGGTAEAAISTATDGQRFWTLGFTGDRTNLNVDGQDFSVVTAGDGEAYFAINAQSDDFAELDDLLVSDDVAQIFVALNRLDNAVDEVGDPLQLVKVSGTFDRNAHVLGTADIHGTRGLGHPTPFDVTGDADINFHVIPVPAAAWMGLVVLGGVMTRGRRMVIG